uniref:Uncharacterized protein n=1 Tax=Glycine max TaxID=3847 RepID=A0A0R0LA95_SOYBN
MAELSVGDPSRKIVEMIFQKAWFNTSKPMKKVRTVLRKYKEYVKKVASEQNPRHPRSTVDGNELLRLYGTTMICFQGKSSKKVHDLCKDPSCYLCQIIQFNFNTRYAEIHLNTKYINAKKAAIICRIIAGTAVNEVDGEYEGSHSTGLGEM